MRFSRIIVYCVVLAALAAGGRSFAQVPAPETPAETAPTESAAAETEAAPAQAPAGTAPAPSAATLSPPAAAEPENVSPFPASTPPSLPATILSAGILVDGLYYDIDMPWGHKKFEELRAFYLTPGGERWLKAVMQKSLPYLAYVEERIEAYQLPKELIYLPIVESEYSPYAVSKSGATGIWQFMRNSISGYGLSISDWKDDRKDFMKSTDAALRKLKDNYQDFRDWSLAIAAYNAGVGAVSRALKTFGGKNADFWDLYENNKLSGESLSYVPKFLAIASILRYPELHGLPSDWGEKDTWEALETSRQVDLRVLSERAGISLDILKMGNAELRYHITPPGDAHLVKVPSSYAEAARSVLEDKSAPLFKYNIYKVKAGDTLSGIAQRYAMPLNVVIQANKGIKADKIAIGQTIIIPQLSGSPASAKAAAGTAPTAAASAGEVYSVKKGDTLSIIAQRFGVKPSAIADRNGISVNSVLRIGQQLKIPSS